MRCRKKALLSLKEHYDMDEVSNLSGFDRRMRECTEVLFGGLPEKRFV